MLVRETITVSALNRAVAGLLTRTFPLARVRGEMANLSRAASGHWYFTLKDAAAQVRCAMFRGRNVLVDFAPRDGDEVEVVAQVGLYEARGEFQLNVESLRRSGLGRLYERFLQLKERLAREGLFDTSRKRGLPSFPRAIGIVTSLQAAALRDVLTTLARRAPHVQLLVYPAPVQGEGAGERLAAMLGVVSRRAEVDVVLLVRGGGSIEDLWAFNEETLARAICACAVPVVVGVGHEHDDTIADFVADLRAPTPTAAAELVAPDRAALLQTLAERQLQLRRGTGSRLQSKQQRLDYAMRSLPSPRAPLRGLSARLQELALRASGALARTAAGRARAIAEEQARLQRVRPEVGTKRHVLQARWTALIVAARHLAHRRGHDASTLGGRLQALDPNAVLQRGYAIAFGADGRAVRDAATLHSGDRLQLQFLRGRALTQVLSSEPERPPQKPR